MDNESKILNREIFLGLWKIHILHHASEGPVVGQWMLNELREHGYDVSPGTLYPLLKRMERHGWLSAEQVGDRPNATRKYLITSYGRRILERIQKQVGELRHEVLGEAAQSPKDRQSTWKTLSST